MVRRLGPVSGLRSPTRFWQAPGLYPPRRLHRGDPGDAEGAVAADPAEVAAFLSAASGGRLEALDVAAVHTGRRRGELLGLKWSDLDLEAGTLSVQRSLDKDGTFNPPKRNRSRRTVKLTAQAAEALKGHRARQNGERLRGSALSGKIGALCSRTGPANR